MTNFLNKLGFNNNSRIFLQAVSTVAIPIALQSLIQSSLAMIDQIMVAQLGGTAMASVGIANRPFTILFFLLLGTAGGLGIFAAQHWGNNKPEKFPMLMNIAFKVGIVLVLILQFPSLFLPTQTMGLFSSDLSVITEGAGFMQILSFSFLPFLLTILYSTLLKSTNIVKLPALAGFISVLANTFLNWLLIFGNLGFPKMGVDGAALATTLSRFLECAILLSVIYRLKLPAAIPFRTLFSLNCNSDNDLPFIKVTAPLLAGEMIFVSSITFYAILYGNMGTDEMAAMTVLFPLQGLTFGLFSGLSTASAVLVGQQLGAGKLKDAKQYATRLVRMGFFFTLLLCLMFMAVLPIYLRWFSLTPTVETMAWQLIFTALIFLPIQVVNMILGDGVLRCSGQTRFILKMLACTLCGLGIPLGIYTAFLLKWPLHLVFAAVSFEEFVRMIIGFYRMHSGKWLVRLTT